MLAEVLATRDICMCTESVIEWCPRGELIMELKYVGGGGMNITETGLHCL